MCAGIVSRCKYYANPKYEYRDFFPLSEIVESQPPGYQARLAFYAQGTRNAHVLLSRTSNPNVLVDNVYEFSKYVNLNIFQTFILTKPLFLPFVESWVAG